MHLHSSFSLFCFFEGTYRECAGRADDWNRQLSYKPAQELFSHQESFQDSQVWMNPGV